MVLYFSTQIFPLLHLFFLLQNPIRLVIEYMCLDWVTCGCIRECCNVQRACQALQYLNDMLIRLWGQGIVNEDKKLTVPSDALYQEQA
jgi:hypothetical protein